VGLTSADKAAGIASSATEAIPKLIGQRQKERQFLLYRRDYFHWFHCVPYSALGSACRGVNLSSIAVLQIFCVLLPEHRCVRLNCTESLLDSQLANQGKLAGFSIGCAPSALTPVFGPGFVATHLERSYRPMDFIERIFHIAPDYRSGALETTLLLASLAIPVVLAVLRASRLRRPFVDRLRG
jgi:hypothetical protein